MGFSSDELVARLQGVPPAARVAFAASCAERVLPCYGVFRAMHRWGDPAALRAALDRAWGAALGEQMSVGEAKRLAAECEALFPDDEVFDSDSVPFAHDAVAAVMAAVSCSAASNPDDAAWAAESAVEATRKWLLLFAPFPGRPGVDEQARAEDPIALASDAARRHAQWLWTHPRMAAELVNQAEDLAALRGASPPDGHTVSRLRERSAQVGNAFAQSVEAGIRQADAEAPQ